MGFQDNWDAVKRRPEALEGAVIAEGARRVKQLEVAAESAGHGQSARATWLISLSVATVLCGAAGKPLPSERWLLIPAAAVAALAALALAGLCFTYTALWLPAAWRLFERSRSIFTGEVCDLPRTAPTPMPWAGTSQWAWDGSGALVGGVFVVSGGIASAEDVQASLPSVVLQAAGVSLLLAGFMTAWFYRRARPKQHRREG